ncbi:MAG: rhodanese-like domain-containing protein [Cyclobacteriaceae bacterium]|jgi:rhodanese-related sulfurtransferase|nr:rhodanese-like domain-containing protein [Cyclobacteriaceae bacterium]
MEFLTKWFAKAPVVNYAQLVKDGALVVDVRSKGEYGSGHIRGSINIPVDQLANQLSRLPKEKTIITCCASGMRSATARSLLRSHGYDNVYNGGAWGRLQRQL